MNPENNKNHLAGRAYFIAAPLGNPDDITLRSLAMLEKCDFVACEDTRVTGILLSHHGLKKRLFSLHDHNEGTRSQKIIEMLQDGKTVAVIPDGGSPLISDPGFKLLRALLEKGFEVDILPGPSATVLATQWANMSGGEFFFGGFLPKKETEKTKLLQKLGTFEYPLVFFESPHRLLDTLGSISEVLGPRRVVVCRELTKRYQEILRLEDVGKGEKDGKDASDTSRDITLKGEMTIVIQGFSGKRDLGLGKGLDGLRSEVGKLVEKGLRQKEILEKIKGRFDIKRNDLYKLVQELKGAGGEEDKDK